MRVFVMLTILGAKLRKTSGKRVPSRFVRMPVPRIFRRFVRRDDGATAVEFAFIAMPFLALMFAIIETAMVFFAGQALETAAADSARLILTGQAQNFSKDEFKQQVCNRVYTLFDCSAGKEGQQGVLVDVRTYSSFDDIDTSKPIDANKNLTLDREKPEFQLGGPGQIVVVRLLYEWPVYVSLLGSDLSNLKGNKHLLVATVVFRNEPFPVQPKPTS